MPTLTLVSHHLCPYVQRAAIALAEKGVPFHRVNIDLADKPEWFKAISPFGKVPLLKVDEAVRTSGASRRRRTRSRRNERRPTSSRNSPGSSAAWEMGPTSRAIGSRWSTRYSVRFFATSTCSNRSPTTVSSTTHRRSAHGALPSRRDPACAARLPPTIQNGCAPFSGRTTPTSIALPPDHCDGRYAFAAHAPGDQRRKACLSFAANCSSGPLSSADTAARLAATTSGCQDTVQ